MRLRSGLHPPTTCACRMWCKRSCWCTPCCSPCTSKVGDAVHVQLRWPPRSNASGLLDRDAIRRLMVTAAMGAQTTRKTIAPLLDTHRGWGAISQRTFGCSVQRKRGVDLQLVKQSRLSQNGYG